MFSAILLISIFLHEKYLHCLLLLQIWHKTYLFSDRLWALLLQLKAYNKALTPGPAFPTFAIVTSCLLSKQIDVYVLSNVTFHNVLWK